MGKMGTVDVDGVTYYHAQLWAALVAQNIELGTQQNTDRSRVNRLCADLEAAKQQIDDLRGELDFALQQLDDAVSRVKNFQREQVK